MRALLPLSVLVLTACPPGPDAVTKEQMDELLTQVETLQAQVEALQARLPADDESALVTEDGLAEYVDAADLAAELEDYALETYAEQLAANAETAADAYTDAVLQDYATQTYADGAATDAAMAAESNAAAFTTTAISAEASARDGAIAAALVGYALESYCDAAASGAETASAAYTDVAVGTEADARTDADAALGDRVSLIEDDYLVSSDIEDAVRVISVDETWTIDPYGTGDHATLEAAVAALDGYRIGAGATVTLQLEDGTYTLTEPLTFHHPDGGRVRILGDEAAPSDVNLWFTGSDGIVVDEGSALGRLGGVTLHGLTGNGTQSGLTVRGGSSATLGPLVVDEFGYAGILVYGNSYVTVAAEFEDTAGWLQVTDPAVYGVLVTYGSAARLPHASVEGAGSICFYVNATSDLYAANGTAVDCTGNAFRAESNAHGNVTEGSASGGSGRAFEAEVGSVLTARYSIAADSTYEAYYSQYGSVIMADYSTVTSGLAGFRPLIFSVISAYGTDVSGTGTAYSPVFNSFIYAADVVGDTTTSTSGNDTTDFVYGL